jgi:hypothetical protein
VYRRAHLSRTMTLIVALLLTAVSTSTSAREFRSADTQSEAYPAVQALRFPEAAMCLSRFMRDKKDLEDRLCEQAEAAGVKIVPDFDRKPFEAAMAGIYDKARDPAIAQLIDRIRKVE